MHLPFALLETMNALYAGHLGASLGVVELTVALHYVFNTPDDKASFPSDEDFQSGMHLSRNTLLRAYWRLIHTFVDNPGGTSVSVGTLSTLSFVAQIIWDVGHQAYGHKILTGRRNRMPTIRQTGGLSGENADVSKPWPFPSMRAMALPSSLSVLTPMAPCRIHKQS